MLITTPAGSGWAAMLRMPAEAFVGAAYREILGRPADPDGYRRYLKLARSWGWRRRLRIVRELWRSEEATRRFGRAASTTSPSPLTLENVVEGDEPTFVDRSFELVNGRAADSAWRLYCSDALRAGIARAVLVGELRYCAEGVARGVRIRGLFLALLFHRFSSGKFPRPPHEALHQPKHVNAPPQRAAASAIPPQATGRRVPPDVAVFTIAARNYLPYVRVLMDSLQRFHPDFCLYLVLADEPSLATPEAFEVLPSTALGVPCFDDMSVRYNVLEFCTALKPFALRHLLRDVGASNVIYLDPDTRLYAPLTRVLELLASGCSVILTPHITEPQNDTRRPDDQQFLRTGVFNLGFAAARKCGESLAFIDWWADKLRTKCRVDFVDNLFTDQRWCDLAPCLLPNLAVLRDRGFNVAYWNLAHRPLRRDQSGRWFAADEPLVFFHFSGLNIESPDDVSKHQDRLHLSMMPDAAPLFEDYVAAVRHEQASAPSRAVWSYGIADNGATLPEAMRAFYRDRHAESDPRPRAVLLAELRQLSIEPTTNGVAPGRTVPGLLAHLHAARPDLQRTFDLSEPSDVRDLTAWYENCAIHVDGLGAYLKATGESV